MSIAKTLISNEIKRLQRIKGDRNEAVKRMNAVDEKDRDADFAESTKKKADEVTKADKDIAELQADLKKL